MKESVVIKSNKYGLTLVLDPDIDFEQLVRDVCAKFANSRNFFGEIELILTIEGRSVSGREASVIAEAIQLNSDITITLINENNELKDKRMMEMIDKFYYDSIYKNAKIIRGSIGNDKTITSDGSIVILGNVKQKGRVEAAGNIIVFGEIYGEVHAGYPDNNSCYIIANSIEAEEISIGKYRGSSEPKKKLFRKNKTSDSLVAAIWNKQLVCEPLSMGLIKQLS
ncbi:MAG: hypothetical protein K6B67_10235 [Lachnospiraceae bacterium]|nr:hypothetical protein [Lachnospiraceae bacterium]